MINKKKLLLAASIVSVSQSQCIMWRSIGIPFRITRKTIVMLSAAYLGGKIGADEYIETAYAYCEPFIANTLVKTKLHEEIKIAFYDLINQSQEIIFKKDIARLGELKTNIDKLKLQKKELHVLDRFYARLSIRSLEEQSNNFFSTTLQINNK